MKPWWEKWPGRLHHELRALDAATIPWSKDEESEQRGVLRLVVSPSVDGCIVQLVATFPDLYPYFRVEVRAPALDLPHHQNPFGKNLCLLPRRTHFWDTNNTLAELINERLPLVLRAGLAENREAVTALEQHQAEPFSDYYPYAPSMVIVQSEWSIPSTQRYGTFTVATDTPADRHPGMLMRGTMVEIRGEQDQLLITADRAFRVAFAGRTLEGVWIRTSAPIATDDHGEFLERLLHSHPFARRAKPNHVREGWLRILGVLFPEEVAWRTSGDGWVFISAVDKKRPQVNRPHFLKQKVATQRRKGKRRNR